MAAMQLHCRRVTVIHSRFLFWRPPCLLRMVIVNLKSDPDLALKGLLWGSRGSWLTLRDAALLKSNAIATPLDGEAVVHRSNVAFLQVLS